MADIQTRLEESVTRAVQVTLGSGFENVPPAVRPAANPQFGDYQADLAMGLAKRVGQPPRTIAEHLADVLQKEPWAEEVSVAGPGFINFRLRDDELLRYGQALQNDERLGVEAALTPARVVVDYSSPNVAKEMHVGHLRSTIIGDTIARVLGFLGHTVIRKNHVGDWGTQFGMLIEHLIDQPQTSGSGTNEIAALNHIYQAAKQRFDNEPAFAERARQRVVALQAGDAESVRQWQQLVDLSAVYFNDVYARLHVLLQPEDVQGESAYNSRLAGVVADLDVLGMLQLSDGAAVVYPDGFTDRDGKPMPMIVRKSDGGYLYATTDLAAARYRLTELGAERLIYVTDARQRDHFAMVFSILRSAGWASPDVRLEHVAFGSVLGKDRKPFKTRTGGVVRLVDLIAEAETRAEQTIAEKNPDVSTEQRTRIAQVIGVGALKYADLASDRIKDYVFDWDKMLAFDGNTAPYLQNAYVRIQAIFRKGGVDPMSLTSAKLILAEPQERRLLLQLLRFPRAVHLVSDSLEPHHLCGYLYELATLFHHFYEHCPVLGANEELRISRLELCGLVARTLATGLALLGIGVVEQM